MCNSDRENTLNRIMFYYYYYYLFYIIMLHTVISYGKRKKRAFFANILGTFLVVIYDERVNN